MALDFPIAPIVGQLHPDPVVAGVPQYRWDGLVWQSGSLDSTQFVLKTGDTVTGQLISSAVGDYASSFQASGPGAWVGAYDTTDLLEPGFWLGRKGFDRWALATSAEPETGAHAGSNLRIIRVGDAQAPLPDVLNINRATGLATVAGDPAVALGIATKGYVDAAIAINVPAPPDLSGYVAKAGDSMTGKLHTMNAAGVLSQAGPSNSFEIYSASAGDDPFITFHRPGAFAANFGLGSDNHFYMGGYSYGANVFYKLWSQLDFNYIPVNKAGDVMGGSLTVTGDITATSNLWTGATVYFRANGGIYLTHDGSLFSMSQGLNLYGSLVTHGSHVTTVNIYNSAMYATHEIHYGHRLCMTGVHGGNYNLDGTANTIWVGNGGMITIISNFSGLVQVNSHTSGTIELFLCGGGSVTRIGSSNGSALISGAYAAPQNGYVFYNNTGSDSAFGVIVLRTRGGA